jgi:hypothetical protein
MRKFKAIDVSQLPVITNIFKVLFSNIPYTESKLMKVKEIICKTGKIKTGSHPLVLQSTLFFFSESHASFLISSDCTIKCCSRRNAL